jgi:hypothetical protein
MRTDHKRDFTPTDRSHGNLSLTGAGASSGCDTAPRGGNVEFFLGAGMVGAAVKSVIERQSFQTRVWGEKSSAESSYLQCL